MSQSFVNLLRCAFKGARPRADLAIAAVLLDRAGLTPADLAPGAVVSLAMPHALDAPLVDLLRRVFPDRAVARSSEDRFGADLWVVHARFVEDGLVDASIAGATLLVIGDANAKRSAGIRAASRQFGVPDLLPGVVEDVLAAVFESADVDAPAGHVSFAQLVVACRPAIKSAVEAIRVLKRMIEDSDPPDADDGARSLGDILEKAADASRKKVEADEAKKATAAETDKDRGAQIDRDRAAPAVRLRDLTGYGPAKDWGLQLARDLAAYRAGDLPWDDVDKGLMLAGPPGCGKTFFARALAAECGVPLIETSYAAWEASTGTNNLILKSVKAVFEDARKRAPVIVFIDEFDSVGVRNRRAHNSGWFNVIVNALLAELDGAKPRDGVVVVAATNIPDEVDPALLRPGRLERTIAIPTPGLDDIVGFLRLHLGPMRDRARAAKACRGRSPAEVAKIAREARRLARAAGRKRATANDVIAAVAGGRRKDARLDRLAAIHEAGHAIVGVSLGVGIQSLDVDVGRVNEAEMPTVLTLRDIEARIALAMGGQAAEEALLGVASTGAASDHQHAATDALVALSSGLLGPMAGAMADAALLDPAIRRRVDEMVTAGLTRARSIVSDRMGDLRRLAELAQKERYLTGDEIEAAMAPAPSGLGDELQASELAPEREAW